MSTTSVRPDKIHRAALRQTTRLDGARFKPVVAPAAPRESAETDQSGAAEGTQSLSAIVATALGPVDLPGPIRLVAALEAASDRVGRAESAVPGLSDLVRAVLDEEVAKINRYLDISGA